MTQWAMIFLMLYQTHAVLKYEQSREICNLLYIYIKYKICYKCYKYVIKYENMLPTEMHTTQMVMQKMSELGDSLVDKM